MPNDTPAQQSTDTVGLCGAFRLGAMTAPADFTCDEWEHAT